GISRPHACPTRSRRYPTAPRCTCSTNVPKPSRRCAAGRSRSQVLGDERSLLRIQPHVDVGRVFERHYDVPVQAKRDSAESDTDGGTSAPFVAQVVFGSGLIARCSAPPLRSASSPNHARFSGSPLSDADCTYLPAS